MFLHIFFSSPGLGFLQDSLLKDQQVILQPKFLFCFQCPTADGLKKKKANPTTAEKNAFLRLKNVQPPHPEKYAGNGTQPVQGNKEGLYRLDSFVGRQALLQAGLHLLSSVPQATF